MNTIYVNTVDTRQGSLMHSMLSMSTLSIQKHIHTFLPITFLIFKRFSICKKFWKAKKAKAFQPYHQYYLCRYCQYSFHTSYVLCIKCCVRAANTSVNSVDKHSIKCIACFDLHIDSVDKQDTLLNSIALIFCINHLDMPSCPFKLQCRF